MANGWTPQAGGGSRLSGQLVAVLALLLCCGIPALPIYLWRKGRLNAQWGLGLAAAWIAFVVVVVAVTPDEDTDPDPAAKKVRETAPAALADVPPTSTPPSTPAATDSPTAATSTPTAQAEPKPKPKPKPAPAPEPRTDPLFGTCGEANDHGFGNYQAGIDPEYSHYQDRDGDGVVCEF